MTYDDTDPDCPPLGTVTEYVVQQRFPEGRRSSGLWRNHEWYPRLNRGMVPTAARFRDRDLAKALHCLKLERERSVRYGHRAEYRLIKETLIRVVVDGPIEVIDDTVPIPGECSDCGKGPDACVCDPT